MDCPAPIENVNIELYYLIDNEFSIPEYTITIAVSDIKTIAEATIINHRYRLPEITVRNAAKITVLYRRPRDGVIYYVPTYRDAGV